MISHKTVPKQMEDSDHLEQYLMISNKREKFDNLYKSEKIVFEKYLSKCKTVLDVGCLYGGSSLALKKFNVKYFGIDTDRKALQLGKRFVMPGTDQHCSLSLYRVGAGDHCVNYSNTSRAMY